MNNIPQKNVILGFRESNQLPYQEADVKYFNNQSINSINLNNTFQQLRDNDLYIENRLNYISSYTVGPKPFSEETASSNFVDGQKYWMNIGSADDLSILHKVNKKPEETLTKVNTTQNVNYLVRFSGKFFAGTNTNILTSDDGITWGSFKSGPSYTYFVDTEKLIIGKDKNIFVVEFNSGDDGTTSLDIKQINKNNSFTGNPTAIKIDNYDNMFVGTSDGQIYQSRTKIGNYSVLIQSESNVDFESTTLKFSDGGKINDFEFRSFNSTFDETNYIIVNLSNGLAESDYDKDYINQSLDNFDSKKINDIIKHGDDIYIATSNGLYKNNQSTTIIAGNEIYALKEFGGKLYCLCKNGSNPAVYWLNGTNLELVFTITGSSSTPTDFEILQAKDEVLYFVSTTEGIWYSVKKSDQYTIKQIETQSNLNTKEIGISQSGSKINLFASQEDQQKNHFTVYQMSRQGNNYVVATDTADIDNFNRVRTASNTLSNGLYSVDGMAFYVDGSALKYINGDILHTFSSPVKKITKISDTIIGSGYIVLTSQGIYFINSRGNVSNIKLNRNFSIPNINDILNIIFNGEYVLLVTSDQIYICNYDESNGLETKKVFSSNQIKDGVISLNSMYLLSGSNLMSANIQLTSNTNAIEFQYWVLGDWESDDSGPHTINPVDYIDYSGNNYIVASGNKVYFLNAQTEEGGDETSAVLIVDKEYNENIVNIQYRDDRAIIATTTSAFVYDIDDNSVIESYVYDHTSGQIKFAAFVNDEIAIAANNGLYITEYQSTNTPITGLVNPSSTKDWDFNYTIDGDDTRLKYAYSDNNGLSVKYDETIENIYSASINSIKMLMNDHLYVSLKRSDDSCELKVFGLSSDILASDYQNYITLDSDYTQVFQNIYSCGTHGIFIGTDGVYIDNYYLSDYTLTAEVRDSAKTEQWKYPITGRLVKVIGFTGGSIKNIDYEITDSNSITLYALHNNSNENKLYTANIYFVNTDGDWKLYPNIVNFFDGVSHINVNVSNGANVKKLFIFNTVEFKHEAVILIGDTLYHTSFDDEDTSINQGTELLQNVRDVFKDTSNNQIYAITTDNKIIDVFSLKEFASGITTSVVIKGIGKQNGTGFAYSNTANTVNFVHISSEKQVVKYNNATGIKKIIQDDGVLYLLNGNQINWCGKYPFISILKNLSFRTDILPTNIIDFDVQSNKLYCVASGNNKEIKVYQYDEDSDKFTSTSITYTTPNPINQLKQVGYGMGEVSNSQSDIAVKFASGGFDTLTQTTPALMFSRIATNVSKLVQDDDFNLFALTGTSIVKITNAETSPKVPSGASSLFASEHGFIYHSTDGKDYWWNEESSTSQQKCLADSNFTGLRISDGAIYTMKDDGLYKVVYKKDYAIPAVRIYRDNNTIVQISPQNGSLDTNLVLQVDDKDSEPRQYKAMFFNASKTVSKVNSGLKITSIPGVQDNKNDFDRFIILRNSNNSSKVAYDGVSQFWVSKNGSNYENWSTEFTNNLNIIDGYQFGNTIWLVLEKSSKYSIWKIDGLNDHIRVFKWKKNQTDINLRKFLQIGENTYVVDSDDGIFYLRGNSFIRMSEPRISFRALKDISLDFSSSNFYYAVADKLYKAQNFKKASAKSENVFVNINNSSSRINDFIPLNSYEFIFATENGIWATRYAFTLKNDLTFYKEQNVNSIYASMLTNEIDKKVTEVIDNHVDILHNPNSVITRINTDIEDVNFSTTPPDWTKISFFDNNYSINISNDIPVEIYFGNQDDNGISVNTSNFLGSLKPNFNYVVKKYASGITEITMLVDTTNTYYISHVYDAGYSSLKEDAFRRKNIEKFGTDIAQLSTNTILGFDYYKTSISVLLDTNHYKIDKLLDSQIYGCSLPLKIYLDVDSEQPASSKEITAMYQSRVIPSRFRMASSTTPYSQVTLGVELTAYRFIGECFGSDQQSIQIHFYDPDNIYDPNGFTILFHGNDGYYRTKDKISYSQKFSLEESKQLKRNLFESYFSEAKVEKIFMGWSLSSVPDNNAEWVDFQNMEVVNADSIMTQRNTREEYVEHNILPDIKQGTVVHLYAVWQTYRFTEDDTILELNVGQDRFSINKYDINPSTNLKDVVLVNFENL